MHRVGFVCRPDGLCRPLRASESGQAFLMREAARPVCTLRSAAGTSQWCLQRPSQGVGGS